MKNFHGPFITYIFPQLCSSNATPEKNKFVGEKKGDVDEGWLKTPVPVLFFLPPSNVWNYKEKY